MILLSLVPINEKEKQKLNQLDNWAATITVPLLHISSRKSMDTSYIIDYPHSFMVAQINKSSRNEGIDVKKKEYSHGKY